MNSEQCVYSQDYMKLFWILKPSDKTNKNKAWKLSGKKEHSEYGGPNATGAADFSLEIMKTTKQWNLEKSKNSAMHKTIA